MGQLSRVQKCYHCGAILQSDDPNKEGYITPNIFNQFPDGLLLCNNCYKNERFSNAPKEASFDQDYVTLLEEIKRKNALVVYTIDLFSFEGSFISKINTLLDGIDVLVVANKKDLLPKDANVENLKNYVAHRLRLIKLSVLDVVITSTGKETYNIEEMYQKILEHSKNRDVYFIGASISGKSALISELLKLYQNNTNKMIVTYSFEGTSLRGFRIPLSNDHYLFETPGTAIDNTLIGKVEKRLQNVIIPKKSIVPKKFSLTKGSFLMIGGLACLELVDGEKTPIKLFAANTIESKVKKGNVDKVFLSNIKKGSLKPVSENLVDLKDFDAYDIEVKEQGERDIGIAGLGWVSLIGNNQLFRIYVPKGVYVYTTRSKVKNVK